MVMMKLISMTDDILLLTLVVPQDAVPNDYTNVAVAACDDGM